MTVLEAGLRNVNAGRYEYREKRCRQARQRSEQIVVG
jgi:uncharacterized protein HemY